MSQENVELVLRQNPGPELDLAQVFRDDARWAARAEARARIYHEDVQYFRPGLVGGKTFTGIDGLRAGWLDWLTPWATYRVTVEKAIDLGDQVLLLHRSFGRLEGTTHEVEFTGANLWTIRGGRIARLETYTTHEEALKAVGLEEFEMSGESATPDLVERTRQMFDAASRRDSDAVLSFFAPDAVMDLSDGGLGTFRGIAAVGGFLEDWFGTWDSYRVAPEEVCDFGNGVVFIAYGEQASLGSGGGVEQRRAWCLVWAEDLISFVAVYHDPEPARAAAERLAEERG